MAKTENNTETEIDEQAEGQKPAKYFADQFDDEEVLFVFRKHPVVMRRGLIVGMLFLVLGVIPSAAWPQIGFGWFFGGLAIGAAVGAIVFMPWWITWYFSVFIITDQRFIEINQKGLFNKRVHDINLNQIQAVSYEVKGISETLLGFGTIRMRSYIGEVIITQVHHPEKVKNKMVSLLRDQAPMPSSYAYENETTEEV